MLGTQCRGWGRWGRVWLDIMPSNNRCLLSGSHLGALSLMKVPEGEIIALELMSFFIKIKERTGAGLALVYRGSSSTQQQEY